MAYNGHVVVVGPNDRNQEAIFREADRQNVPVLFFNNATNLWNWKDIAGVTFAGSGTNPVNYEPDMVACRAALDAVGLDIP